MKDLTVILQNKPGTLADMGQALGKATDREKVLWNSSESCRLVWCFEQKRRSVISVM